MKVLRGKRCGLVPIKNLAAICPLGQLAKVLKGIFQGFGSGSGLDLDSVGPVDPDPDPGGQKWPTKVVKNW